MKQTLESAFYKMVLGHKIKEKVDINKFLEQIQEYKKEEISITKHTLFRLNEKQKKAYDEEFIRELLFNETPFLAGIQYNNLWAIFYKYKKEIFRVIIDIQTNKIYIVTFYIINEKQVPKI